MSSAVYDVVVVGAGIEGSSTAYHCAKQGKKTLLLEKFPLPHSRGSSHGHSRITRKAYGSANYYTRMMEEAYRLWEDLEKEAGVTIYRQCGCLVIGSQDNKFMVETKACMERHNLPHSSLSGKQLKKDFPMLTYPDTHGAILDYSGGILRSDIALTAFQAMFKRYGGEIRDGEEMVSIFPGSVVTVTTKTNQYKTKSIVLTVGPWATKILPLIGVHVPLKPMKLSVYYWREKTMGEYSIDTCPNIIERKAVAISDEMYGIYALPSNEYPGLVKPIKIPVFYWKETKDDVHHITCFPTFIHESANKMHDVYGLPSMEYPGHVKVCLHHGPAIDPDRRDDVDTTWVLEAMKDYVSKHFTGLESSPSIVESCIYTNTPDHDFILDVHPFWKNIVIGAGFSGHGFKLAPVVGKLLAELATNRSPSYDMSHFEISRFYQKQAKL